MSLERTQVIAYVQLTQKTYSAEKPLAPSWYPFVCETTRCNGRLGGLTTTYEY